MSSAREILDRGHDLLRKPNSEIDLDDALGLLDEALDLLGTLTEESVETCSGMVPDQASSND